MNLQTYYDNYLVSGLVYTTTTATPRTQTDLDLGTDSASLHRNIGAVVSFSSIEQAVFYEWQPSYLPEPEDSFERPTDWMDQGTMHYKFVHGCRIHADTGGVARTVQIQYDGGINGPVLTVTHSGELVLPYTFPPFKARMMRLLPTDANSWRLWGVEWEIDSEPEPVSYWVTQPTTFDMRGYLHIRDFQFAYATVNAGGVLTVIVDGTSYTLIASIPSSGGSEVKKYYPAPPIKGKVWQLYGTGTALQIYVRDCEFRLKSWGDPQYSIVKPLGDVNRTSGGAVI
jgi:hypothetical protein